MSKIPRIQIKGLQKSYKLKKNNYCIALADLSLNVYDRDFLVLLGESGCGKTTLLKVIVGIEDYDYGEIYFSGIEASKIEQIDKNMSYVSQNYVLFPHKTVYENIDMPLSFLKWDKRDRKNRIQELSQLLGLDILLTRKPKELSGGQCQRVAIARAIAKNPDICLFDEPLSALDPIYKDDIINLLKEVHKKTFATYIYSTHNQLEAVNLATRIAIMHKLKIEQIGMPEEIINHPKTSYIASFLNQFYAFVTTLSIKEDNNLYFSNGVKFPNYKNLKYEDYKNKKIELGVRKTAFIFNKGQIEMNIRFLNDTTYRLFFLEYEFDIDISSEVIIDEENINVDIDTTQCALFIDGNNIE